MAKKRFMLYFMPGNIKCLYLMMINLASCFIILDLILDGV